LRVQHLRQLIEFVVALPPGAGVAPVHRLAPVEVQRPVPRSANRRNSDTSSSRSFGSIPRSGSSATTHAGARTITSATSGRFRSPPERSCGLWSTTSTSP